MILPRKYLALVLALGICGAQNIGLAQETNQADALIEYPHASDIKYYKVGLTDQVSYHVEERFPASHVIGFIASRLRKAGWTASTVDLMNPDMPPRESKWSEIIN